MDSRFRFVATTEWRRASVLPNARCELTSLRGKRKPQVHFGGERAPSSPVALRRIAFAEAP